MIFILLELLTTHLLQVFKWLDDDNGIDDNDENVQKENYILPSLPLQYFPMCLQIFFTNIDDDNGICGKTRKTNT